MVILANDGTTDIVKKWCLENNHNLIDEKIPQEELKDYINNNNVDVIMVRSATKVNKEVLSSNLKGVIRAGVGLDNVDLEESKERGIQVFNTPNSSTRSVAELVFAHIFSIYRNLPLGTGSGSEGFKTNKSIKGREIKGKYLGIIGYGRIGREVETIAKALGMRVIVHDPFVEGTQDLNYLLKNSDIVTLHCPYTGEPVLTEREFKLMNEGSVIINCARGGVIEETLLKKNEDKFLGIGLDTFENEPNVDIHFVHNSKYVCTPHIGAQTVEAQTRISYEVIDRLTDLDRM